MSDLALAPRRPTPREILEDFNQYAPRFLRVKQREGARMVPLHLKPVQRRMDRVVNHFHRQGRPALIQVDKSRRLGTTSYVAGRFTHRTATRKYQRAIVMAHRGPDAKKIFQIYEWMHEHLPKPVRPLKSGGKGTQLNFYKLYSQIDVGSAESTTFGRGGDSQLIHLSECAYYRDPEELMSAILPGVSAVGDAIVIAESTANGPGSWWADFWKRSEMGTSRFTPLFFAWYEDPEHILPESVPMDDWTEEEREWVTRYKVNGQQIAWLRWRQEVDCQGRDDRRRREYPASAKDSFSAVGQVAWSAEHILRCYKRTEPEFVGMLTDHGLRKKVDGELHIYEHPMPMCDYVLGADPAGGLSDGDLCVGSVWRVGRKPGQWPVQAAEWSGHEDPVTFAKTLTMLGTYYRKALLACEVTGIGKGCQAALQKTYFYPRLHRWVRWDSYKARGDTWGWETTPTSKDILMGLADWLIRSSHVTIRSSSLMNEILHYQEVSPGEYECVWGDGHGDRLMAAFIAWASWFQHLYGGVPLKQLRDTLTRLYGGVSKGEIPQSAWQPAGEGESGEDPALIQAPSLADIEQVDMSRVWNRRQRGQYLGEVDF